MRGLQQKQKGRAQTHSAIMQDTAKQQVENDVIP